MKKQPNIILITTDQQRFDTLGVNGNAMIKTPNLDQLASEGVNFSNAFVQNTVCVPSRACIQTGRYIHQHGATYMESVIDNTPGLPEWELTFMEHLQKNGYYTGATGKIHMYPEKGFDWHNLTGGKGSRWLQAEGSPLGPGPLGPKYAAWLDNKRPGAYEDMYVQRRTQESYKKMSLLETPLSKEEYIEHWIAEQSIDFIIEHSSREKPFFLWCGFCGPHTPFDPPAPYRDLYDPEKIPLPVELEGWPSWRDKENWDESLLRKCIAYYWAMVTCIDEYVGALVKTLKEQNIYDETLIIFTSDHGEMLGERMRFGKSVFYDSVINVPLIVKTPANEKYLPGKTDQLTEIMNIAPTILDYGGIEKPENMTAKSLRTIIEEGSDGTDAVYSEYVRNDRAEFSKCIRTATHKYIRYFNSGEEEFYDLVKDPIEQHNLAKTKQQQEIMLELKDRLFNWLARTEARNNY